MTYDERRALKAIISQTRLARMRDEAATIEHWRCDHCGDDFRPNAPLRGIQLYCNATCRDAADYQRGKQKTAVA